MATMVNNRKRYIAEHISHRYCLKVIKFHCNSFSGLRAVGESLVGGEGAMCLVLWSILGAIFDQTASKRDAAHCKKCHFVEDRPE